MAKRNQQSKKIIVYLLVAALVVVGAAAVFISTYVHKAQYPLEHQEAILQYSAEYNLDPLLVCALIYTESSFRAEVTSSKGAVGLMQIMPDTGVWIAEMNGLSLDPALLTVPEINIRIGCAYLRYLFNRFEVQDLVVASYNAGPTRVAGWLKDAQYSADGKTLTDIPFKETRNYIDKIQNAYTQYQKLYQNQLQ